MTDQKDRITVALSEIDACWAITADKCILPDDDFDAQPAYHIHPDQSEPHANCIQRFSSLMELEDWIKDQRPPQRRERVRGKRRTVKLPQGWVDALVKTDGSLQAAIERLVKEELAK